MAVRGHEAVMMKNIKVYSTRTCPYCGMAKEFLSEKGVDFEDVDVGADRRAAMEMFARSGQMGVPQIMINGKMIVGFDREALEKEIGEMEK